LSISKSSYYEYVKGKTHQSAIETGLADEVRIVFQTHRRRYGSRRIRAELKERGYKAGRHKIRKLLKEQGLQAIQPRSFVPKTTQSRHGLAASPNLLEDKFECLGPNQVWVSDITYIPIKDGKWVYLAVWMDRYSRKIVGWNLDVHMREELILEAFKNAVSRYKPTQGLIVHSDRGGQYFGTRFRKLLNQYLFRQSMAGKKSVYENAHAESIWASLKRELLEKGQFDSVEDAKIELFDYIEVYYNRIRKHSALDYMSPEKFEQIYKQNELVTLQSKLSV